ncbi:hypothetical protein G6O67_003584 [Ophiocordyceps sinensis]|uniref:Peptidase M14 domain-containing protein n=1 Tax=Ophiocordyceps sinensis TaxID=72228 RepID=A0A8H4PS41_9HYPO|nr:hypothetical protein G6O67_003584 [Ophiocordyceps sinensis]
MKLWYALLLVAFSLQAGACIVPGEHGGAKDQGSRRHAQKRDSIQSPTASAGSAEPTFTEIPYGKGDRFRKGRSAPISSGLRGIARAHGDDVRHFRPPERTYHNRHLEGLAIGDPRVFILGGIHARERGGPDHVLYFLADLLTARALDTGLRYGDVTYTNEQVRDVLTAGLVVLPLANPDGAAWDQRTNSCWLKNRNASGRAAGGRPGVGVGVDLDRNFAYLWDYKRLFNATPGFVTAASDDPKSDMFHGSAPLSEAETRNVAWVLRRYRWRLAWFVNLHSFSGSVLYGWGDGDVQTTDSRQSFTNASYDGTRGIPMLGHDDADDGSTGSGGAPYGEFMEADDLHAEKTAAERMRSAMTRVGATAYEALPLSWVMASSGSCVDQARGPYYARECGAARVHGLVVEFGGPSASPACPFYPDAAAYHDSVRQVAVGLMELLLTAAEKTGDGREPKMHLC